MQFKKHLMMASLVSITAMNVMASSSKQEVGDYEAVQAYYAGDRVSSILGKLKGSLEEQKLQLEQELQRYTSLSNKYEENLGKVVDAQEVIATQISLKDAKNRLKVLYLENETLKAKKDFFEQASYAPAVEKLFNLKAPAADMQSCRKLRNQNMNYCGEHPNFSWQLDANHLCPDCRTQPFDLTGNILRWQRYNGQKYITWRSQDDVLKELYGIDATVVNNVYAGLAHYKHDTPAYRHGFVEWQAQVFARYNKMVAKQEALETKLRKLGKKRDKKLSKTMVPSAQLEIKSKFYRKFNENNPKLDKVKKEMGYITFIKNKLEELYNHLKTNHHIT